MLDQRKTGTDIAILQTGQDAYRKIFGNPNQSRVAYLRYLRRERQQSSRMQADADHVKVKTERRQLGLVEKKRELVRRTDVDALIDEIAGTVLTHLSGINARCSRDRLGRRNIDAMVTQIRRDISDACSQAADARNEPLLDEQ
jgi:hypothetical protein